MPNSALAQRSIDLPESCGFLEVKATFDQAFENKLDGGDLRQNIYYLAFLRGDAAQMEQQVAWGAGKPSNEDALLWLHSDTEAYYGQMSKARDFFRRAVESAARAAGNGQYRRPVRMVLHTCARGLSRPPSW